MEGTTILSLLISVISLTFSVLTYVVNISRGRKQATINAFQSLQNEVLDKANTYTKKRVTEIATSPRSPEYKELSALLARIEHFSVGVNTNIYDRRIVCRLAGVYFIALYDKLSPLIDKKRAISRAERHYDEFERLVLLMKADYAHRKRHPAASLQESAAEET